MGKWLFRFLAEHQESAPDIPDILISVSGLSGSDFWGTAENRDQRHADLSAIPPVTGAFPAPRMQPTSPLKPGWLVVYRGPDGKLWGGPEDRERGTVCNTEYGHGGFQVELTNGSSVPLRAVRAVSISDEVGAIVMAWETAACGVDGQGRSEYGQ